MSAIALKHPGVANSVAFPGLSVNGFVNAVERRHRLRGPQAGRRTRRHGRARRARRIVGQLNQQFAGIQDAFVAIFPPPAVQGLGQVGGFKLYVEDRAGLGFEELYAQVQGGLAAGRGEPALAGLFSSFQVSVPQIDAQVDRERAKSYGVTLSDVFETLQVYLGSLYVNDFNQFGRTYQVNVQAESDFRMQAEQIPRLKTRNAAGSMVPLGSLVTSEPRLRTRPGDALQRVSRRRDQWCAGARLQLGPGAGRDRAHARPDAAARHGLRVDRAGLSGDRLGQHDGLHLSAVRAARLRRARGAVPELVAAAQRHPDRADDDAVGIAGVWLTGGDNNVFTQISFLVLAGLACKNAILIVEFARHREEQGDDRRTAILTACRIRLRPVLMTSVAFIMGVVPLVISTGAGAEIRQAMGVAVFAGMLGVTVFGLFLTPVFYATVGAVVARLTARRAATAVAAPMATPAEGH